MPSSFDGIPLSFRKSTMAALSASSSSLEKRLPLSAGSDWPPHWRFLAPSTPVDALRLLAPEPAASSARLRFLGGALSFFAWASLAFLTASAALALASLSAFFFFASLSAFFFSFSFALATTSARVRVSRGTGAAHTCAARTQFAPSAGAGGVRARPAPSTGAHRHILARGQGSTRALPSLRIPPAHTASERPRRRPPAAAPRRRLCPRRACARTRTATHPSWPRPRRP